MQLNKKTGAVYLILIGDCLHLKKKEKERKAEDRHPTGSREKPTQQLNPA